MGHLRKTAIALNAQAIKQINLNVFVRKSRIRLIIRNRTFVLVGENHSNCKAMKPARQGGKVNHQTNLDQQMVQAIYFWEPGIRESLQNPVVQDHEMIKSRHETDYLCR